MTPQEIRDEINANPAILGLVPNTFALAEALSAGRKRFKYTEIGKGTILQVLGIVDGNSVIDAILSIPDYRHIRELLEQGRLRLDIAAQGNILLPLVSLNVMTQLQHDELCDVAKEPDVISEYSVRVAIFNDNGSLKV